MSDMHFTLDRPVFLIGFSGSGKTSAGLLLARRLAVPFVDTDAAIEKREQRTIAEIFADEGEAAFRTMERDTVREALKNEPVFVGSLGGGAFEQAAIREQTLAKAIVVYLRCSPEELHERLRKVQDRPLLADSDLENRIAEMLRERTPRYEMAHVTIDTTNLSPEQTAGEVLAALKEYQRAN